MSEHVIYAEAHAVPIEPIPVAPHSFHRGASAPAMSASGSFYAPSTTPAAAGPPLPTINEAVARDYLAAHKWPLGLQNTSIDQLKKIAFRFVICDDSGSMMASDGHRVMTAPNGNSKYDRCFLHKIWLFF